MFTGTWQMGILRIERTKRRRQKYANKYMCHANEYVRGGLEGETYVDKIFFTTLLLCAIVVLHRGKPNGDGVTTCWLARRLRTGVKKKAVRKKGRPEKNGRHCQLTALYGVDYVCLSMGYDGFHTTSEDYVVYVLGCTQKNTRTKQAAQ